MIDVLIIRIVISVVYVVKVSRYAPEFSSGAP